MNLDRLFERKEILESKISNLECEIADFKERLEYIDREIMDMQESEAKQNELAYQKMKL